MTITNVDDTLKEYAKKGDTKGVSQVVQKILAEKIIKENSTSQQVPTAVDGLERVTDTIKTKLLDEETAKDVIKGFDKVLFATAEASETEKDVVKKETGVKFMEMINYITPRLRRDDIIIRPENNSVVTLAAMTTCGRRYAQLAITNDNNTAAMRAVDDVDTADPFSISVPCNAVNSNGKTVRFMFMARNVFLRAAVDLRAGQTVSDQILSAKVDKSVKDLNPPVVIKFTVRKGPQSFSCVFWDETTYKLSSEGCKTFRKPENATDTSVVVTCYCDRLNTFALLMTTNSGTWFGRMMSVFTYLGTVLSVLGLAMTIVTYVKFEKLRASRPGRILLSLSGTLLVANLVFIVGAWCKPRFDTDADLGCKAVGMLLHYCYLSAMLWSSAESVQLYLAIVRVYDAHIGWFFLKAGAVAWLVPAVVVALTAGASKGDGYGLIGDSSVGAVNAICFMKKSAFYGGFMAPILLLMTANVVAFALVLRQMRPSSAVRQADGESATVGQVQGAIGLCLLLGLTWTFMVFALDGVSAFVFQLLFVIAHTLQGAVVFVVYCLMKQETGEAWGKYVPFLRALVKPDASTGGNALNGTGMQSSSQTTTSMGSWVSSRSVKKSGLSGETDIEPLVN